MYLHGPGHTEQEQRIVHHMGGQGDIPTCFAATVL